MTKRVLAFLAVSLLAACMSLPGSNSTPAARYMLSGKDANCSDGERPLSLTVTTVGAGLDSDRIARRNADTGEFYYLKGVSWIEATDSMVEQRLAADLECSGYTVITSHHRMLRQDQLVCEVRALNLLQSKGQNEAEVALSCVLFAVGSESLSLRVQQSAKLERWSTGAAVAALSRAYQQAFAELAARLP
ncbi:MAG: ABC-type transport auxiliary lipoprotein family protein [Halieaceae bacterium]